MKSKKLYVMIATGMMIIFLAACAVNESYKQGQDLAKDNRWEEAIAYFEKAVKEEPDNQEYKDALAGAKKDAAKARFVKARQALSAAGQNFPVLEKIARDVDAMAAMDPSSAEIKALRSEVTGKINSLKTELKTLYQQSEMDMQKEEWAAAISKLSQINKIFPNYEDTGNRLSRSRQEGSKALYQQANDFGKQEDWKAAAELFKQAKDINPNYLDVSRRYEDAKHKDNLNYYMTEGAKAEAAKNLERAIILYEKAMDYPSVDASVGGKLDSLKAKAGQLYLEDSVKLFRQGKLYAAMKKLDVVRKFAPSLQNDPIYREHLTVICDTLMKRAEKFSEKELWGNALIWLQKIDAVNPNYPELFQKTNEIKDAINKRIRKSIAVFDFSSPSAEKDAGKIAANKLIAYLYKHASADLRIIERENLQSILKEMQLSQTGLVDIKTAQSVGKMRGIDTFIMGDVLHFSTKYTDAPSLSQVRVLVSEDDMPNPDWSDWRILNPKPSADDLKNAPPRTIKKPNYQLLSYKQGVAKISALLEISFKLVDTQTGENIFANTVSGKLIKDDKYQDGVPIGNIKQDPLELPTEAEVMDELTNSKVSEMGSGVLKHFQSLEVEYYNQALSQQKRRNLDLAVEKYTDAIFDEKLKGISTPISKKSAETIEKLIADK
ncbi:MAG: Curli production assembly/transport component CsgG [Smithella sp. PtaU1.Bin162]|nr:MAG: Curli production assembly/transport component CsgG [Smithella sp. PtaU1.Bin162]